MNLQEPLVAPPPISDTTQKLCDDLFKSLEEETFYKTMFPKYNKYDLVEKKRYLYRDWNRWERG